MCVLYNGGETVIYRQADKDTRRPAHTYTRTHMRTELINHRCVQPRTLKVEFSRSDLETKTDGTLWQRVIFLSDALDEKYHDDKLKQWPVSLGCAVAFQTVALCEL